MHSPSPQLLRALRTSISSSTRSSILRNAPVFPRAVPSILCPTPSPASPLPATRRSNSSTPRPTRMTPRGHAHKPASRDRGPESAESTTTDFDALNVLGTMPAPTTGIDACLDTGFHLNSGVKVTGGDAVLLVGGEAFSWRPWQATEAQNVRAAKAAMINDKGQLELDEQVWGLLSVVWPRPDLLILGLGASIHPLSPKTKHHINSLGIRVEVQDTRNAAAQFNLLATERGVTEIAAALIPIGWNGRS